MSIWFPSGTVGAAKDSAAPDVSILDAWQSITPGGSAFNPSAGTNRLLVVAVGVEASEIDLTGATFGDQTMANDVISTTTNAGFHTSVGIFTLNDAGIEAATGNLIDFTADQTASDEEVFVAVYENVDQTTPVSDTDGAFTNSGQVGAVSVNTNDGGFAVAVGMSNAQTTTSWSGLTEELDVDSGSSTVSVADDATTGVTVNATPTFAATPARSSAAAIAIDKA